MNQTTLQATPKGELTHLKQGKRKSLQLRLTPSEHKELMQTAKREHRSMSFVALRRYQNGRQLER